MIRFILFIVFFPWSLLFIRGFWIVFLVFFILVGVFAAIQPPNGVIVP